MDRATIEPAIKIVMIEIHSKLNEAARIAKAAEACALAGSVAEGGTVLMDIEQMIYEAGRLEDGGPPLNRLSREKRRVPPALRPSLIGGGRAVAGPTGCCFPA